MKTADVEPVFNNIENSIDAWTYFISHLKIAFGAGLGIVSLFRIHAKKALTKCPSSRSFELSLQVQPLLLQQVSTVHGGTFA